MGQGIIRVAQQVFEDLNRPFQFEAWHKALLLPDAFRVVDAHCNPILHGHNDHYVTVESDLIPESPLAGHPDLIPVYARTRQGEPVMLMRILHGATGQNLLRVEMK